jgi:hypothetical protein
VLKRLLKFMIFGAFFLQKQFLEEEERRKKKSTRVGWNIIYWDRPRDQHEISPPKKVLTTE